MADSNLIHGPAGLSVDCIERSLPLLLLESENEVAGDQNLSHLLERVVHLLDRGVVETLHPAPGDRDAVRLYRGSNVDIWVISWTCGADTDWHDHDASSGGMHVIEGVLTQQTMNFGKGANRGTELSTGQALTFPTDHIHRVHCLSESALTLHSYAPPLDRMGFYHVDSQGSLRRELVNCGEQAASAGLSGTIRPQTRNRALRRPSL